MTTLHITVDLSVDASADPTEVADWLFEHLVDLPEADLHPAINSVDGADPVVR